MVPISIGLGHLRTVLKSLRGVTGVLYLLCSSLILLNPFKTNFPVDHKTLIERPRISSKQASWFGQNTWKFCTEPLLMVYKIDWVYLLLFQRSIYKTGSDDVFFNCSCFVSFERIFKCCKYMQLELSSHLRWLIMITYINFHYLLPG